ncbi:hypothetical protein PRUB_a4192 [Pseudoalteromonas rubra]|uniref:Uncharacterized protein n=1 Tax=Pseudoalteromonas rubra TaxID=43658 RepID=A0A8T0C438_9GAMM|nr:hypothetical protein PRUB_a4192 [Pseudoalteromonas rubra]
MFNALVICFNIANRDLVRQVGAEPAYAGPKVAVPMTRVSYLVKEAYPDIAKLQE